MSQTEIEFAKYLKTFARKANIVVVCNKCDGDVDEDEVINEVSSRLGFENIFLCSGEKGTGVLELLNYINDLIPEERKEQLQQTKQQRKAKF